MTITYWHDILLLPNKKHFKLRLLCPVCSVLWSMCFMLSKEGRKMKIESSVCIYTYKHTTNKTKYFKLHLSDEVRTERPETDLRLTWDLWKKMKIQCFRALCAGQTDRQTDRRTDSVTPWAPWRSQKCFMYVNILFISFILERNYLDIWSNEDDMKIFLIIDGIRNKWTISVICSNIHSYFKNWQISLYACVFKYLSVWIQTIPNNWQS